MRGRVSDCRGKTYELPELFSWELTRTGSVPCDCFRVCCPCSPEMAQLLPEAVRFEAVEDGRNVFTGILDDYALSCGENGTTLELTGRGAAALLLDNEAEAVNYQNATLREIVRRYVHSLGIPCTADSDADTAYEYSVANGASFWRAVQGFSELCGVTPYFTRDGGLELLKKHRAAQILLSDDSSLRSALYREKRCGVISEITVIDRSHRTRQTVRNEEFCRRGGLCRRVLYAPRSASLHGTGARQIKKSQRDSRLLMMAFSGKMDAEPWDMAQVNCRRIGVRGDFRVSEVTRSLSAAGEVTELTLQEESICG